MLVAWCPDGGVVAVHNGVGSGTLTITEPSDNVPEQAVKVILGWSLIRALTVNVKQQTCATFN